MGIQAPAPVTRNLIPVQTHAFFDSKRKDLGLTDRQTLKSAKYDRLLYGRKNIEPGLAKHLVNYNLLRLVWTVEESPLRCRGRCSRRIRGQSSGRVRGSLGRSSSAQRTTQQQLSSSQIPVQTKLSCSLVLKELRRHITTSREVWRARAGGSASQVEGNQREEVHLQEQAEPIIPRHFLSVRPRIQC